MHHALADAEMRVDHVSIAVPRIDEALAFFQRHFPVQMGVPPIPGYTPDFTWCDFYLGRFKIELIEPVGEDGFVTRFLQKRGPGMHHICLEVDDIDGMLAQLKEKGVQLINEEPKVNADGRKYAFIHPRSANGVMVELYELPK
jgi:methylmalonyl-CoA/ethylmalonyl-CoA epimerase